VRQRRQEVLTARVWGLGLGAQIKRKAVPGALVKIEVAEEDVALALGEIVHETIHLERRVLVVDVDENDVHGWRAESQLGHVSSQLPVGHLC
jgi:hypothetical protein